MSAIVRNFNDLFHVAYNLSDPTSSTWSGVSTSATQYHQSSTETEHVIEVPLVGMNRDNVNIDVQDGVLTISATSESKSRFVRSFKNSWSLSKDSDADNVSAHLENGLLTVRVPRVKPAKKVVNVSIV